jgi:hypothetical protein
MGREATSDRRDVLLNRTLSRFRRDLFKLREDLHTAASDRVVVDLLELIHRREGVYESLKLTAATDLCEVGKVLPMGERFEREDALFVEFAP